MRIAAYECLGFVEASLYLTLAGSRLQRGGLLADDHGTWTETCLCFRPYGKLKCQERLAVNLMCLLRTA